MISSFRTLALVGGTLGLLMASAPARADLIGDTIDFQDLAIGDITVGDDPGSMDVRDAAVYPLGAFQLYPLSLFEAEVTGSQLTLTLVDPIPAGPYTLHISGPSDGLNEFVVGFVLYDLTNPSDITEAVVDPSSTLPYNAVFLYGGALYVDLQDINVVGAPYTNFTLVVDLATPAPEPGTIGLITTGFAGLVVLRRRRSA